MFKFFYYLLVLLASWTIAGVLIVGDTPFVTSYLCLIIGYFIGWITRK